MKIFNRLFIAAAAIMMIAACVDEQPLELSVDSTEILIGPDGGVRNVKVSASQKWLATTAGRWSTV